MSELIAKFVGQGGCDASHRADNKDTHLTHLHAAGNVPIGRVRSDGAFYVADYSRHFPSFPESADRKQVEVGQ